MKIGLIADVHEDVERLGLALRALRDCEALVVLGDLADTGERLDELIAVIEGLPVAGVWGNHDFGLCGEVHPVVRKRLREPVLRWFAGLRPFLELAGCRFQHIDPHLDPSDPEHLWAFVSPDERRRGFAAHAHRRVFIGHQHAWALSTPAGVIPWRGERSIVLEPETRYVAVIHAVCEGWCACFDTEREELTPISL